MNKGDRVTDLARTVPARIEFDLVPDWPQLPDGLDLGDVGGIGVDREDNVYVFNRGAHPMVVFDRGGHFLRSWGEGLFSNPHGVHIGPDDMLYLTDTGTHTVTKCTTLGEVVLRIGVTNVAAPPMSGHPFNRCTHSALGPDGSIYVSDGYGNARVHKYSADGEHLLSWGQPGIEPGSFNVPHNIVCDAEGTVFVADRENHRIQRFDSDGRFLGSWHDFHRPCAFAHDSRSGLFYIGEAGPGLPINLHTPNLGQQILIVNSTAERVGQYGSRTHGANGADFVAPHGIAVDSRGDLYIGEVSRMAWPDYYEGAPAPTGLRTIRKLAIANRSTTEP